MPFTTDAWALHFSSQLPSAGDDITELSELDVASSIDVANASVVQTAQDNDTAFDTGFGSSALLDGSFNRADDVDVVGGNLEAQVATDGVAVEQGDVTDIDLFGGGFGDDIFSASSTQLTNAINVTNASEVSTVQDNDTAVNTGEFSSALISDSFNSANSVSVVGGNTQVAIADGGIQVAEGDITDFG